ncbi:hypothetical protein CRYUN_Cryun38cG0040900 [Craigia yunnanensis]
MKPIKTFQDIELENLVKFCGCCVEGNHRILVYGYLENNSFAQTLLGRGNSSMQFRWQARRNICIGVAKGLAFLHEEVRPHIHRDIKASNILLDKSLMPKISDFGLAKVFPDNLTHISTSVTGTTFVSYFAYTLSCLPCFFCIRLSSTHGASLLKTKHSMLRHKTGHAAT